MKKMKKRIFIVFCTVILTLCFFVGCSAKKDEIQANIALSKDSKTEVPKTTSLKVDENKSELNLVLLEQIETGTTYNDKLPLDLYNININAPVNIDVHNEIAVYKSSPFTQEEVNEYIKLFDKDYDFSIKGTLTIANGFGLGRTGYNPKTDDPATNANFLMGNFTDDEKQCGYVAYANVVTPMEYEMRIENMYEEVYPAQVMEYEWLDTKEKLQELTSLTEDEAIDKAKEFLTSIGINEMQVALIELKPQTVKKKNSAYYDICFANTLNNDLPSHSDVGMSATMYPTVSKYSTHCVDVAVDERGIVGFRNVARKEKTETIKENIEVISFENAVEIVKENIESVLANYPQNSEILIDKITLGTVYVPIDGQTMRSTPVWDFEGAVLTQEEGIKTGYALPHSIIRVNAIDGSVINRHLGY